MADAATSKAQQHSHLPHELRLHILSFLPPNDLALGAGLQGAGPAPV